MDYIYGKLCQRVKEVQYSGGITDTIQVNVDQDTNVITADYIGEQSDVTKEYVDEQIAGLSTKYLSLNGGTMRDALTVGAEDIDSYTTIDTDTITVNAGPDGETTIFGGELTVSNKATIGYIKFNVLSMGPGEPDYTMGADDSDITINATTVNFQHYNATTDTRDPIRLGGIATPTNKNDAVNKTYVDSLVYVQDAPEWGGGSKWEVTAEELQKLKTAPVIMITNYGMLNGIVVNKGIYENYVTLYAVGKDVSSDWQARVDFGVFYLQGTEPPSTND